MADWDTSNPTDNAIVAQFPSNERAARSALVTNFAVDHYSTNDANVGKHTVVRLLEQAAQTATAGEGKLYAKDTAGQSELFWISDAGSPIQLTSGANGLLVNASNILSGTLPDARLSANVPLLNAANTFTNRLQSITATSVANAAWVLTADSSVAVFGVSDQSSGLVIGDAAGNAIVTGATGVVLSADNTNAHHKFTSSNTTTTFNGVAVSDFARLSQNNTFSSTASTQGIQSTGANDARLTFSTSSTSRGELTAIGANGNLITGSLAADMALYVATGRFIIGAGAGSAPLFVMTNAGNFDFKSGTATWGGNFTVPSGWSVTTGGGTLSLLGTGETLATFADDGAVTLYYDNSAKLNTKTDGVNIVGEIEADSLDIDGAADISGTLTVGAITTPNGVNITGATQGMEIGAVGSSNTPYIDWHSGATGVDYDSRIQSSGGSGSNGGGTITITAATTSFSNAVTVGSTLGVAGAATLSSTLAVTGTSTLAGAVTAATIANSTSTTLVAGQLHFVTGDATLPNLTAGQWVQVINDSGSAITISKNGSDTTYWATTGASVSTSFSLAARGLLTARCSPAGNVVYVSGAGITGAT